MAVKIVNFDAITNGGALEGYTENSVTFNTATTAAGIVGVNPSGTAGSIKGAIAGSVYKILGFTSISKNYKVGANVTFKEYGNWDFSLRGRDTGGFTGTSVGDYYQLVLDGKSGSSIRASILKVISGASTTLVAATALSVSLNTAYDIELVMDNESISMTLNGSPVSGLSVTDGSIAANGAPGFRQGSFTSGNGMMEVNGLTLTDIIVAPIDLYNSFLVPAFLHLKDQSGLEFGNSSAYGWNPAGYTQSPGLRTFQPGSVISTILNAVCASSFTPATPDYGVMASLLYGGDTIDTALQSAQIGICARIQSSNNAHYGLTLTRAGTLTAHVFNGTTRTTLGTPYAAGAIATGGRAVLGLVVNGNALLCYLNGVLRISTTDSTIATAGRAGIVGSTATVNNDGVKIRSFMPVTGINPAMLHPDRVKLAANGQIQEINLYGLNVTWSAATAFTITNNAGATATLVGSAFVSTTHVKIFLNAGKTLGSVSISDGTNTAIAIQIPYFEEYGSKISLIPPGTFESNYSIIPAALNKPIIGVNDSKAPFLLTDSKFENNGLAKFFAPNSAGNYESFETDSLLNSLSEISPGQGFILAKSASTKPLQIAASNTKGNYLKLQKINWVNPGGWSVGYTGLLAGVGTAAQTTTWDFVITPSNLPIRATGITGTAFGINPYQSFPEDLDAPFGAVRIFIHWTKANPSEDVYDWGDTNGLHLTNAINRYKAAGMRVMLVIEQTPPWAAQRPGAQASQGSPTLGTTSVPIMDKYNKFVRQLCVQFYGKIDFIMPWNEGNTTLYWDGTIPELVALHMQCAATAKAVDPNILIASNAFVAGPYFDLSNPYGGAALGLKQLVEFMSYGALNHCDILCLNWYTNASQIQEGNFAENVVILQKLLKIFGHPSMPIAITEYACKGSSVSVIRAIEQVTRMTALGYAFGIAQFYYFVWFQGNSEINVSIKDTELRFAMAQLIQWMDGWRIISEHGAIQSTANYFGEDRHRASDFRVLRLENMATPGIYRYLAWTNATPFRLNTANLPSAVTTVADLNGTSYTIASNDVGITNLPRLLS